MNITELLASNLTDEQHAAIIATCDQLRADGVSNSLNLVAAKEAAEAMAEKLNTDHAAALSAVQQKASNDLAAKDALLAAASIKSASDLETLRAELIAKSISDSAAAVLVVQQTYDALLQRAVTAIGTLPPEVQAALMASDLGPVLTESAAHTSDARKAAAQARVDALQKQLDEAKANLG